MARKRSKPKKSTKTPEEIALDRINDVEQTGATKLDLSELGLTEIPGEILRLHQLASLNTS